MSASVAMLALCASCGGESSREARTCRAGWREIQIPAEFHEFRSASSLWFDGRLFLFRAEPHGGELLGAEKVLVYELPGRFTRTSERDAPSFVSLGKVIAIGREIIVLNDGVAASEDNVDDVIFGGRYQVDADQWTPLPSLSTSAYGRKYSTGAASMGDSILFALTTLEGEQEAIAPHYLAFHPGTNEWSEISSDGAADPSPLAWSGSSVFGWGGGFLPNNQLGTGALYDPASDAWTAVAEERAPSERERHTLTWTGNQFVVWGGIAEGEALATGAFYDPDQDAWLPVTNVGAPSARSSHLAVTGRGQVIVWGGMGGADYHDLADGGVYDPATDTWSTVPTRCGPGALWGSSFSWVGDGVILWGGSRRSACLDASDPEACAASYGEHAWYLPADALFGETPSDPEGCSCPFALGDD